MKKNYFLLSLIVVLTFFAPAIKAQSSVCPVIITQPNELKIDNIDKKTYNGADLSCSNAADGQITVTASGGTTPYQYSKDNGATYQSSNVFSGLSAGIYQIVVKDANGCTTAPLQINITAPAALTMSIEQWDVTCFGDNNGRITVTVSGGSGKYRFSKDGGRSFTDFQDGNEYTFENLVAGTYNIVAEDENGCSAACP